MRNKGQGFIRTFSAVFAGLTVSGPAWAQQKSAGYTTTANAVTAGVEKMFGTELSTARKMLDMIAEFFVKYSFQALGGIIVVLLGWFMAKAVAKAVQDMLGKKGFDVTVTKFLISIIKILIMAFAVLVALGKFGITIAPFIAGLSVIGFGASFAVQGPLSNYAAGATLIFTKPFKVGDIVEIAGEAGEVTDMTLSRTELKTLDGTVIFIPNKHIIGEIIQNFSEYKKLDLNIGISYDADYDRAIQIVRDVVTAEGRISSKPAPKIGISEFADSSVNIYSRLWCRQSDYYDVLFDLNRKIFMEFNANGITIPFPQRDVHIIEKKV